MRLVYDNEINSGSFAPSERLDAADLDRLLTIGARMNALHDSDAFDRFGLECRNGLVNEGERGNHERDTPAFGEGSSNDVRSDDRLAGAGRKLKHWPPVTGCE